MPVKSERLTKSAFTIALKALNLGITHTEYTDEIGHTITLNAPAGKHFPVEDGSPITEESHYLQRDEFEDPASFHRFMMLEDLKNSAADPEDEEFKLIECPENCACRNPKNV